jgi:hypothetical protein
MKNFKLIGITLLTLIVFSSCSDDHSHDHGANEEELITTVTTTLTSGNQTITLTSKDLDGNGPNPPVVTASGDLTVNTTYTGAIKFLNESVSPAIDITKEIKEEGLEHQIFYQAAASIGAFTYTDADTKGNPIGLAFTLRTAASPTTGTITVVLRHEPNKTAAGVAQGAIANAGGSTDASVTYNVVLK